METVNTTALRIQEMAELSVIAWHFDVSHGWLKVSYDGWNESPFDSCPSPLRFASKYSYVNERAKVVYLEEDSDAPAFLAYYEIDANANSIDDGDESSIRHLPRGKAEVLPELSAE